MSSGRPPLGWLALRSAVLSCLIARKALPRLHRKPKAGQSGNAIAGSRAATVQSFGTPKDAAGAHLLSERLFRREDGELARLNAR
jgi:hypothetical protein